MSQSSTDYTETLKKIKETEEATSRDVLERRKALEEELRRLEEDSAAKIADAKKQAETIVGNEVEKARSSAQRDADALLAKTYSETKQISSQKQDKAALKKIIDQVVLSEFK